MILLCMHVRHRPVRTSAGSHHRMPSVINGRFREWGSPLYLFRVTNIPTIPAHWRKSRSKTKQCLLRSYPGRQIVQHDDVGAGAGCLAGLFRGAALHLDLTGQAAHRPRGLHRLDGSYQLGKAPLVIAHFSYTRQTQSAQKKRKKIKHMD